jgi:myo-inositol-1(or 4)-monophosphatase
VNDLASAAELALRVGRHAGELLRARPREVRHKGAIDLVTEIDLASEARIREVLATESPGVPVQGEEGGGVTTGLRWVVDPLDGTTNFVHGYPFYGVSIALVDGDRPLAGCVYDPVRDRGHAAWRGGGSFVAAAGELLDRASRVSVSDTTDIAGALCVTGFPYDRRERADTYLAFVARVLKATHGMRRSGSAAMDLAMLAEGASDLFWEFGLKPWDTSAGVVLVEEAGGRVSRLDGSVWTPGAAEIVASNARVHEAALGMLRGEG